MRTFPRLVLWAWEEGQDLRFLKGKAIGVACFSEHLRLRGNAVDVRRRRTPLLVDGGTPLMAVVRIDGDLKVPPVLDGLQLSAVQAEIEADLARPGIQALQLDFDARPREQAFYGLLLKALRKAHPTLPISMTALLSWCRQGSWLSGLPVDEAVPMCFRMGDAAEDYRQRLASGRELDPLSARQALGLSFDEPYTFLPRAWRQTRRIYVFRPGRWTPDDVDHLQQELYR